MWSSPRIKLVTSTGEERSRSQSTPGAGRTATYGNSTAEVGYFYYGAVRPAFNQVGTDTIRLQLRVR